MEYDFKHIESKWQEKWEEEGVFHAVEHSDKPKFYGTCGISLSRAEPVCT